MESEVIAMLAKALGPELVKQQAQQFGVGLKHDLTNVAPISVGYMHGEGGLLTFPGVDPMAFHTVMGPLSILGQLPTRASVETSPVYWTLTGIGADTGDEPDGVCDDAPVGGLIRGCLTRSVFGRYERATAQLEINRLGQRTNRGEPMDIRLVNGPMQPGGSVFGGMNNTSPADVLTNEVSQKFWQRNISFFRLLAAQLWTGNPTNNSAGGGYKEMTGFNTLINTGYVDVETGEACPAMDSRVINYNNTRVDADANRIIATLFDIARHLKFRAERVGVDPVRWSVVMHPELFFHITEVWPCTYLSYRCAPMGDGGVMANFNTSDAIQLRDNMRTGRYLLIEGERWEVQLDDNIPETEIAPGVFSSSMYFIPMSVVGGTAVTYLEYFDFENPSINSALAPQNMALARVDGAFITWPRQKNLCIQWQSKIEPRLVMRTPWLAARVDNIAYAPILHTDSPFPGNAYAMTGGRETREGMSYHDDLWEA